MYCFKYKDAIVCSMHNADMVYQTSINALRHIGYGIAFGGNTKEQIALMQEILTPDNKRLSEENQ